MFIKRLGSLFLAFVSIVAFSVNTYAVETDVYEAPVIDINGYQTVSEVSSGLTISGTTATCRSVAVGLVGVTNITVTQTLQRKNGSSFSNVSGALWSISENDDYVNFENTKSGLSSGTYRVKSFFTVKKGSTTEEITSYSREVTI